MSYNILITGGSGFIGTNLIADYSKKGYSVRNIDVKEPRNKSQLKFWSFIDICDFHALENCFLSFKPDYVIHLAATTEMVENEGIEFYESNIKGVENIVTLCHRKSNIKRVVFASSMLVNKVGFQPQNCFDYNPSTLYGRSKVLGEQIIYKNKDRLTEFCIVRPTSIWGEWFGEPYRNFFDFVLHKKFFHIGKKASTKTYGYVLNSVYQIDKLLFANRVDVNEQVFYIGDYPPINISEWANEIAHEANLTEPKSLPFILFAIAAKMGDLLSHFKIKFPMTGFRLKNMTTHHIIDLRSTYKICGELPFSRIDGIRNTLLWINKNGN